MKLVAKDIYKNEHMVEKDQLLWRPSAYGVLIKDGNILLSPQFRSGAYDLPGGGVEIDETLEEAVIREFREETGLIVRTRRQIGIGDNLFISTHLESEPKAYHSILLFYECEYVEGEITSDNFVDLENEYMKKAEWVSLSRIDDIESASSFDWRPIVKEFIQGLQVWQLNE